MTSIRGRLFNVVTGLAARRADHSPAGLQKLLDKRRDDDPSPPARILRDLEVETTEHDGMTVYRARPHGVVPRRTIVFLHGGAYVFQLVPLHWRLVATLAKRLSAQVVVPVYPLAPGATAARTVPLVAGCVERAAEGGRRLVLMGDSAGGGLAMAVAQRLAASGSDVVERLVLIAPALDLATELPEQRALEARDHTLTVDVLRQVGRMYAGDLDLHDPMVSPLLGTLEGLPPIDVFVGTHDLLVLDSRRLLERASAASVRVTVREERAMQHAYPLNPLLPEAARAVDEIVALLARDAQDG